MPPSDDAAAQRELNATLERFRGDPRAALGLRPSDDATAARRAFMALCKIYHPAKFARFAPATVKLSNEVFLAIRRAYESASTAPAPQAPPARVPTAPTTPPGAGAGTSPADRPSVNIPRIVKFTPPTGIPVMPPTTPPPPQPPPQPPTRPSGTIPRPAPPRPATPSPASPGQVRDAQLDRALDLAQAQKWPEARMAFVELATRHPGDPRYRAYVHYARGWEAFTLGKDAEARAEWQRALACDPRNDLVKWALESTGVVK